MPKTAIQHISSLTALSNAWKVLDSHARGRARNGSGVDNESINAFAANTDRNLRTIQSELHDTLPYSFQLLRPILIPKTNGKYRVICIPTVRDRIVQRALINYLSAGDRCHLANKVSYGFIPERGVRKAINRAKNLRRKKAWAYKTDITTFFDTISRSILQEAIKHEVRSHSLHDLLIAASDCELERPDNESRRVAISNQGIRPGMGVRQGMPLSPFFSNLVLKNFDKSVEQANFKMVRYADDLIIFASSEQECLDVHAFCKSELGKIKLAVPEIGDKSKTIIYHPTDIVEFLGVGIKPDNRDITGYSLQILKPQFKEIRNKFLHLADMAHLRHEQLTLTQLGRRLDGMIAAYLGSYDYCDNVAKLEENLLFWKNETLSRIYKNELGIDVDKLTDDQRHFLGIA